MTTYRSAFWVSANRLDCMQLTTEDQAGLPPQQLLDAAHACAAETGLEIGDGEIEIFEPEPEPEPPRKAE
jgi:hypothetical protein